MKSTSHTFIVMGVSASGKTTLGRALAQATQGQFFDGDDFHPESNRTKMASGIPLSDEDRRDWLNSIAQLIASRKHDGRPVFIACSALKESYREILRIADPTLVLIFLTTDRETLRQRMVSRYESGRHFMPPELLDSQLAALEIPEEAIGLDASQPVAELVSTVLSRITLEPA